MGGLAALAARSCLLELGFDLGRAVARLSVVLITRPRTACAHSPGRPSPLHATATERGLGDPNSGSHARRARRQIARNRALRAIHKPACVYNSGQNPLVPMAVDTFIAALSAAAIGIAMVRILYMFCVCLGALGPSHGHVPHTHIFTTIFNCTATNFITAIHLQLGSYGMRWAGE